MAGVHRHYNPGHLKQGFDGFSSVLCGCEFLIMPHLFSVSF
jgi:hypothetical protein